MPYGLLLEKLKRFGLAQVSRLTTEGYDVVHIGRPGEAIVPFVVMLHPIVLDAGLDSEIDEEIIEALLRRFEIDPDKFAAASAGH